MQKSKANVFVTAFIIILISFTSLNYVYAKNSEIKDNWNVTITNDAKEINDTYKIKFEVQKNKNVVLGKIAPEMKATAEIEINLQKVNGFVDIELEIDDSKLNDVLFNDENISSKSKKKVNAGKIEKVLLELIWNGKDIEDTEIGINIASIEIPVKIKVLQHI